jgi:hypothetical protein
MAHASNQYRKELNEGGRTISNQDKAKAKAKAKAKELNEGGRTISNQDKAKAKAKAKGGLVTNFKGTF